MIGSLKTIGPLHFEDLEPHRFEDLVRQLVYDFRDWANLEATGRTGADEGFDIRGREILYDIDDIDEDEPSSIPEEERIWLIQCKREKSISPKKLGSYLDTIFEDLKESLYGIIFVAPCNFSKKARDTFICRIRQHGIREFQLWGRAELEDLLFQPKNDHLLFAYFGLSISIRKRTLKTKLRSRISTKRKALKCLGHGSRSVLLRDVNDTHYPYDGEVPNFERNPSWKVFDYLEQDHDGLIFLVRKYMAYLADDQIHFDYIKNVNIHQVRNDPWRQKKTDEKEHPDKKIWGELPDKNIAYLEASRVIPYDNILAIDEDGDNYYQGPHFYIPFTRKDGPFTPYFYMKLYTCASHRDRIEIYPETENRIEYFPSSIKKRED